MKRLRVSRTINATQQNRINISVIFNYLRQHGPSHRAKISQHLSISIPAVSRGICELVQEGYVTDVGTIRATNGKRITQFAVNSGKGIVVGVDLIKRNVEIAISDLSGRILHTERGFRISEETDVRRQLSENIARALESFANSRPSETAKVLGIGIGVPAVADLDSGAVIALPLYGSLEGLDLKPELERRFGVPVYVENVVKLSALAEKSFGQGQAYTDIVFFEVSGGVGAGIIVDDHILRGHNGSAGEIGLSIFDARSLGFKTAPRGWLETRASLESLREEMVRRLEQGATSEVLALVDGRVDQITPAQVCEAAFRGDTLARELITEIADLLSLSILQLILIVNPQIVVIGGDLCAVKHAQELFVDRIVSNVERSVPFAPPSIKLSALGENAGVIGASLLAIESLLAGRFPFWLEAIPESRGAMA